MQKCVRNGKGLNIECMNIKIMTKEKEENIKYLFSVAKERKIPDGPEAEYYK